MVKAMKNHDVAIGLVKIPVADFNRATTYYRQTLGLVEEFAVEEYGWAQYSVGGAPLCLYVTGQGGGTGEPGGDCGIHLVVEDAGALHVALSARGADLLGDLSEGDDGTVSFDVRDPDANVIRVMQRQS
jgi:predicted enzyme related to lactoylglutathione lyase